MYPFRPGGKFRDALLGAEGKALIRRRQGLIPSGLGILRGFNRSVHPDQARPRQDLLIVVDGKPAQTRYEDAVDSGLSTRQLRQQVIRRNLLANFLGSIYIATYLAMTGKTGAVSRAHAALNDAVATVILFTVLALVVTRQFRRHLELQGHWIAEGRLPTVAERDALLSQPWWITKRVFGLWVIAAFVSGISVLVPDGARYSIVAFVSVLLGGAVACTLTYLLTESALRPAVARALEGEGPERFIGPTLGQRLFLIWALGSGIPLLGVALTPLIREQGAAAPVWAPMVLLAVVGILAGVRLTRITARSVARPMGQLRIALGRVREGDLSVELAVDDGGEIGVVQAGFNNMTAGLRERERLRVLFGDYVGSEVARRALEEGVELGGEIRQASVLFVDIIGSTTLAQRLPPTEVVTLLNRFFDVVVHRTEAEGGWVNKFEGDGALCVFGAPIPAPDHPARSLRTARALLHNLRDLELDAGIGVSSGEVVAGNVGAVHRYEYTVIGHTVNEAARLTEAAKCRAGRVLAGASTVSASGDEASAWVKTEPVELRGIVGAVNAYEPITSSAVPRGFRA